MGRRRRSGLGGVPGRGARSVGFPSRRPEAAARSAAWPAAWPAPGPRGERARRAAPDPPGYPDLRVALVHDWLTGMRGGERVLEELLALFPRGDVFTLLHVPGSVSPAIEARRITTTFVQRLPGAATRYRSYLPIFPRAVESFDFAGYDLVLSSSHCVAKGARAAHGAPHLCYCHTPMRYVWDQFDAYFGPGRASLPVRAAAAAFAPSLRRWDRASARLVDHFVANSEHCARADQAALRPGRDRGAPAGGRRAVPSSSPPRGLLPDRIGARPLQARRPCHRRVRQARNGHWSWLAADRSFPGCASRRGREPASPAGSRTTPSPT